MSLLTQVRRCLILGATVGLLLPPTAFSSERHHVSPTRDVALQPGGTLHGTILTVQGQAGAGQTISLATNGGRVAEVVTGTDGKFVIGGLRPGVYVVVAGETRGILRLWSDATAPPSATSELLLIDQQSQVVRGMHLPRWDHPLVVGGLLLTAGVIGGIIGYNVRDFDPGS
ncbi:MAG: carboxypeptidase-like regulatory domain-containing protein [Pirellulaceae bacterium]